ncbi:MAG: RnfH family protein [Magnetococcales bacterium]|nr:RnfH family protein [Magnetococcales bacterium]
MKVTVAYAEARKQVVMELETPEGTTALEAVERSSVLDKFPGLTLADKKLGIFGKIVEGAQILNPGDRVEILRPALGKPPKKERGEASQEGEASGEAKPAARPAARSRTSAAAHTPSV